MKETFIDGDKTILKTDYYLYLLQVEVNWKELKKYVNEELSKTYLDLKYANGFLKVNDKMQGLENKDI